MAEGRRVLDQASVGDDRGRGGVRYDPAIIVQFAQGLYDQAANIIALSTIAGALVGGALGFIAGYAVGDHGMPMALAGAGVAGVLGGLFGLSLGRARAFALKLDAQRALVLLQIEVNTRPR